MINLKKIKECSSALPAIVLLFITTTLFFIPILFIGIFKLIPNNWWKDKCTKCIDFISTIWCSINNYYVNKVQKLKVIIHNTVPVTAKDWYLVIANHQSWLDIVILHRLFNHKIPVLKFFIKDQLKWVPLLGFAWWAMGCPFMKRYTKDYLLKKPHKKGKDLIATRKAVEHFKRAPASIMNFVEGTRFTLAKKNYQKSPYTHLLKPKAGGISFIISSMESKIHTILDVTIVYPTDHHSLWDFLCGRVPSVQVAMRLLPIPTQYTSAQLINEERIQTEFKAWLNQQWTTKDKLIDAMTATRNTK